MRREVARVAVTAACIALAVLAVPLAVSVYLLVLANERGELQRAALQAATTEDPSFAADAGRASLARLEPGIQLGLYDTTGRRIAGTGPASADPATAVALRGSDQQGHSGTWLVVAVPAVQSDRTPGTGSSQVVGAIRAASPVKTVWQRTAAGWAGLAAGTSLALTAALIVAARRSRRLAAPLVRLAAASRAIGDGDFDQQVPMSGIAEIDRVAATQNHTARRLGRLLERERQFSADASHQLRTPLTGLQLILENASESAGDPRAALSEALLTTRRLMATVEDVLALHRRGSTGPEPNGVTDPAQDVPLGGLLTELERRWRPRFEAAARPLQSSCAADASGHPVPAVRTTQILDVLLDNALRHGAGPVRIFGRTSGPATAVDVTDAGPGVPATAGDIFHRGPGPGSGPVQDSASGPAAGNRIGLALARDFAASLGGRLVLSSRTPPVFTLLLPEHPGPLGRPDTGRPDQPGEP